jgi:hypothetical protein
MKRRLFYFKKKKQKKKTKRSNETISFLSKGLVQSVKLTEKKKIIKNTYTDYRTEPTFGIKIYTYYRTEISE